MDVKSLIPFRNRQSLAPPDLYVFGSLQREVDQLSEFARGFGAIGSSGNGNGRLVPTMDVSETDKEYQITVELPGLQRDDVDISLEDNVLTIRGEKKVEAEQDDKKKNVHFTERSYGMFYRAPRSCRPASDPSSIKAAMSNGVLKITIPKPARPEAKKIEVKEAA